MNTIARFLGSPFALGTGVLFVAAMICAGIRFGWGSPEFRATHAVMIGATAVGLTVVLWSRASGIRHLAREIDRLAGIHPPTNALNKPQRGGAS